MFDLKNWLNRQSLRGFQEKNSNMLSDNMLANKTYCDNMLQVTYIILPKSMLSKEILLDSMLCEFRLLCYGLTV
jgi:hypothetical protein